MIFFFIQTKKLGFGSPLSGICHLETDRDVLCVQK